MRRSNSLGHWTAYQTNNGAFFTQADLGDLTPNGGGALWQDAGGHQDTVIYGAGLWFGGLRRRGGVLTPHTEYTYNPNTGHSLFVPGSIIYDGAPIDSSQTARDKYRLYRSTDLAGPDWPLRIVNGRAAYIDSIALRASAGRPSTFGDEDIFSIYKDSDPTAVYDSFGDPFFLEVRSRISFWEHGLLNDIAIVQNEIVYSGSDTVFDPVVAMVVDGDIDNPRDDRTKGVQNEGLNATVFFTDQSATEPLLGAMVLEAQHGNRRPNAGVTSLRYWDISDDPITDSDRYQFLTVAKHDTALSGIGDARMLLSSLSHVPLVRGDTMHFAYAFFVRNPTGPALTRQDSAAMLTEAQTIYSHYLSGNLSQLQVHQGALPSPLSCYPNPVDRILHILNPPTGTIAIFDILGRKIEEIESQNDDVKLDVSHLPEGVYYAQIGSKFAFFDVMH